MKINGVNKWKDFEMKYKLKKISGDASFREFYRLKKKTKPQSLSLQKKKNLKILQYIGDK